jgi:tape measure domain-containing protein
MAVEVDPLVLEIRADLKQYRAQLQSTTSLVTSSLGRQEGSIRDLERQMQRSSGAISNSLGSIAGALAGAFSVQQIGALIDNFTRLQNSLRVSGLEGQNLANVQSQLLDLSARYGVSINELADLFGKSSQAAAELGASEAQLVQITEASAQALKITGTSAAQAQGALLGLTQALSSGTVRAEEFNQINEGGLRPLLQVAANTERFGGSVAKLRAAIVDGTFSSKEFYQAILNGSAELEGKANKATLTLAGAFTALSSQLTVYVGEASASNGVTAALAAGIGALANNLDKIIPALATIGAVIGVRYVAGLVAATVASTGLKVASIGLAAALNGTTAATTKTALAMNALGKTVPFLAVTALVTALGFLVTESNNLADATSNATDKLADAEERFKTYKSAAEAAGIPVGKSGATAEIAGDKFDILGGAIGRTTAKYVELAANARLAAIAVSQANIAEAETSLNKSRSRVLAGQFNAFGGVLSRLDIAGGESDRENIAQQRALIRQERANIKFLSALPDGVIKPPPKNDATPPPTTGAGASSASRAGGGSRGASGPSAEELLFRSDSEQRRLDAEILQAKAQLAVNAKDREEFEKQILELEKAQRVADLAQTTGLSEDQRKAQQAVIDELYGTSAELDAQGNIVAEARPGLLAQQINRDSLAQQTQESADAAELEKQILLENLGIQYDLATSIKQRRKIALDIVNAEFDTRIASLEEAKLQSGISDEKRKQLDAEIALTKIRQGRAQTDAKNGNLSPSAQYLKDINELDFGDETDKFGVDALKDLNRGLADAIVNGGNLGDVLEDTGKRFLAQLIELTFQLLVIKPLLESLGGGFGGAVGGFFSLFGGKSRASGGPVSAGQVYRVNEGTRPEYFRPNTGGDVIPLSKMKATPNPQGGVSVVRLELSGDIDARIQSQSAQVAVEVVRAAAPSIVDAGAAKAQRDMGRPRL